MKTQSKDHVVGGGTGNEREDRFASVWEGPRYEDGRIEFEGGPGEKIAFLEYLVKQQGVLLVGSKDKNMHEFKPHESSETAELFGQEKGAVATDDAMLAMWDAILDKDMLSGGTERGYVEQDVNGRLMRKYHLGLTGSDRQKKPWSKGYVYIFAKEGSFTKQSKVKNHRDAYMAQGSTKPIAKIEIDPKDFDLGKIEMISGMQDGEGSGEEVPEAA